MSQQNNIQNDTSKNIFACKYCNKSYSSSSTLKHHQRTAKFCIELQNKELNNKTNVEIELFKCDFCSKEFTVKYSYNCHLSVCKEKKTVEESEHKKSVTDQLDFFKKKISEYEVYTNELNLKLQFRDECISKLEDCIHKLEK